MADETRAPSGVIENTAMIGLAAAIGTALAADVQSAEWRNVIHIGAPIAGKLIQMFLAALIGDTLGGAVVSAAKRVGGGGAAIIAALALGLASAPARAQEQPQVPTIGVGGGSLSLYVLDVGWPSGIGVNAEVVKFRLDAGLLDVGESGRAYPLGLLCLTPKVGDAISFACGAYRPGPLQPAATGG